MALKGGVTPMGCSINVFNPVLNGCEGEHLNRFDPFDAALPMIKHSFVSDTNKEKLPSQSPVIHEDLEYYKALPFVFDLPIIVSRDNT